MLNSLPESCGSSTLKKVNFAETASQGQRPKGVSQRHGACNQKIKCFLLTLQKSATSLVLDVQTNVMQILIPVFARMASLEQRIVQNVLMVTMGIQSVNLVICVTTTGLN